MKVRVLHILQDGRVKVRAWDQEVLDRVVALQQAGKICNYPDYKRIARAITRERQNSRKPGKKQVDSQLARQIRAYLPEVGSTGRPVQAYIMRFRSDRAELVRIDTEEWDRANQ